MRDELERESTCPVSGLRESGSGGTAAVGVEFQPQGRGVVRFAHGAWDTSILCIKGQVRAHVVLSCDLSE